MKAVILCAGKSTRTYPITVNRPKPLIELAGKTIIEHIMDELDGTASEAILVVSDNRIKERIGEKYGKMKISYARQDEPKGTGHAVLQAEKFVGDEKFLVLMGDNFYPREDIRKCLSYGISVLCQRMEKNVESFGTVRTENEFLVGIDEKSAKPKSNIVNTGLYVLNNRIFGEIRNLEESVRGEHEITDALNRLVGKVRIKVFLAEEWIPVTYPWDILALNRKMLSGLKKKIEGSVDDHVMIEGNVFVGKGSVIRSGTHIEGPAYIGENCVVGPNAYIRPYTSLGNNVRFRGEIVNSIVMDSTTAKHTCYIGHSVIGEKVNIAAGTVTGDYRHDGKDHVTLVKGEKVDTGIRKLGAFIGDGVHTGINTSIYPGRKIWPGLSTLPGEVIKEDRMR